MTHTFTQIYLHVVFSVKGRLNLINKQWRDELYKYICGIANNKEQKIFAIGGVGDHIHLLLSIKPAVAPSEIVRDIKANSAKWINERHLVAGNFQWQRGFGAFSISSGQLDNTIRYINNQEEHHRKKSFESEYLDFLKEYNVEFNEKMFFQHME
jgi:REP element-mobilizing transposase RayT